MASLSDNGRLSRPTADTGGQEDSLHHHYPDPDDFDAWEEADADDDDDEMPLRSSPFHRPALNSAHLQQPLLKENDSQQQSNTFVESHERSFDRDHISRRSTFRSRTPDVEDKNLTRRKYILASGFLLLSLVSFVIQTETAVYIQHELHWDKPYCMLYVLCILLNGSLFLIV